jgi:ribose transport system permease protein
MSLPAGVGSELEQGGRPVAATQPGAVRPRLAWFGQHPAVVLVAMLAVLVVSAGLVSSGSVGTGEFETLGLLAAPLGLLAAGETIVMITGGIDLSVASTATMSAYVLSAEGAHGPVVALAAGLGVGAAIGLVNGVGIGIFAVQPLIMTLGMTGVLTGVLTIGAQSFLAGNLAVPNFIINLGTGHLATYIPLDLFVWAPIGVLIVVLLKWTGYGKVLYAVGDNSVACRLAGVRIWQVLVMAYVLTGILAGVAGIVLVGYTGAADLQLGSPELLPAIAAVVIGGTSIFGGSGSYGGSVLGALILTALAELLNALNSPESVREILYGAIIVVLAFAYSRIRQGQGA